ncbi:helix-turn-helix domain-containing protein [Saccharibacillus sp. CPCC 101409]|uniref:helix-turn-helix domain-containing protein n=1 Tax=Saccharibacillus sp. CPCC 101409 TaxID=3058041 RepID=UPI0026728DF1|nr:helix-turn-helix domain-containing protein [Saccharibacillus sp. CPCC 101409]MDO3409921.1 helix-turn-helix domain-containing protein [Saccharibacillus sp. CPCC 101409]
MPILEAVNFDRNIPGWRTRTERLRRPILVLMVQGEAGYTVNGRRMIVRRGDVLVMPRDVIRSGGNVGETPHMKYSVLFRCAPEEEEKIPLLSPGCPGLFRPRDFEAVRRAFERLFFEARESKAYSAYTAEGMLQELLGRLSRERERPEMPPALSECGRAMRLYMLEHYREPVAIGELADLIGRSPNHAAWIYREVNGLPPIRHLHRLRTDEASYLLLHTEMNIAEIAAYLGYYDASAFFRMFKKETGLSPTEFVRSGRGTGPKPF